MGHGNGRDLPFLIAGGGIGGLVAAYSLALKGFPVRALEKIGLKDAILADAWRPGALTMRCGVTGKVITSMPLGAKAEAFFKQPYAVTHRADIHGVFLTACQGNNLISLETKRE